MRVNPSAGVPVKHCVNGVFLCTDAFLGIILSADMQLMHMK